MIAWQARLAKQTFQSKGMTIVICSTLAIQIPHAQKQKNHSETEWLMVVGVDGFRTALAVEPIPYKKAQTKGRAINHYPIGSTADATGEQGGKSHIQTRCLRVDDVEHCESNLL